MLYIVNHQQRKETSPTGSLIGAGNNNKKQIGDKVSERKKSTICMVGLFLVVIATGFINGI